MLKINDSLELTAFRAEDAPLLVAYLQDATIHANTLLLPNPYTASDAAFWLQHNEAIAQERGENLHFAIRYNGHFVGSIGQMPNDKPTNKHKTEIGYWLARPFWGKGLMTTVVRSYADFLLSTNAILRVEATVFTHNTASARVLEKAGFEREGINLKSIYKPSTQQYFDTIMYAKI